ncbi:GNAT family N-acetyltransferase [Piscirickettsia litoralis]|uniref:N-acetyltransferase domain-containing protein n=1 Tax=Piscirickettsia litoralis TaxID=1891921 RepID=A0ABX3A0B8_9GAMM|nr:GNAT family N-acetyltransferase [Piscirickettsia litoralis]ODN41707.1 hypothetical protein BGC07_00300 [Piscirickettsia litoralis]
MPKEISYFVISPQDIKSNARLQRQLVAVDTFAFLDEDLKDELLDSSTSLSALSLILDPLPNTESSFKARQNIETIQEIRNAKSTHYIGDNALIYIAFSGSEPVGYLELENRGGIYGTVNRLAVSPTHKRKGIGKGLLEKSLKSAFHKMSLDQVRVNASESAIGFYKKHLFSGNSSSLATQDYENKKSKMMGDLATIFKDNLYKDDLTLNECDKPYNLDTSSYGM